MTWHVVLDPDHAAAPERVGDDERVWTLSRDSFRPGWETDRGSDGYGLCRADALELAQAANTVEAMGKDLTRARAEVENLRAALFHIANHPVWKDALDRHSALTKTHPDDRPLNEADLVYGFYEGDVPRYSQGPRQSEVQELMTAKEANALVQQIVELKSRLQSLNIGEE